jgi:hypothetical protein
MSDCDLDRGGSREHLRELVSRPYLVDVLRRTHGRATERYQRTERGRVVVALLSRFSVWTALYDEQELELDSAAAADVVAVVATVAGVAATRAATGVLGLVHLRSSPSPFGMILTIVRRRGARQRFSDGLQLSSPHPSQAYPEQAMLLLPTFARQQLSPGGQ